MNAPTTTNTLTTHEQLVAIADRIRAREVWAVIETGKDLLKAKKIIGHGSFGGWLQHHTGMELRTARRYMQVARWADSLPEAKTDKLSLLPTVALYELSAKSTSKPAREAVFEALEAGDRLSHKNIRFLINRHDTPEDDGEATPVDSAVTSTSAEEPTDYRESGGSVEVLTPETISAPEPGKPLSKSRKPTTAQLERQELEAERDRQHAGTCQIFRKLDRSDIEQLIRLERWAGFGDSKEWLWLRLEFDPESLSETGPGKLLRCYGLEDTPENRQRLKQIKAASWNDADRRARPGVEVDQVVDDDPLVIPAVFKRGRTA